MTTTTGFVQLPPRLGAPAPFVPARHVAVQERLAQQPQPALMQPAPTPTRRVDRVTVALAVGAAASLGCSAIGAFMLAVVL